MYIHIHIYTYTYTYSYILKYKYTHLHLDIYYPDYIIKLVLASVLSSETASDLLHMFVDIVTFVR